MRKIKMHIAHLILGLYMFWAHVIEVTMCACSVVSTSLRPHGLQPARLLYPLDFPGKNTGVGCHFVLQGIFLTLGLESGSPAWQADSLPSEPPGKPQEKVEEKVK